MDVLQYASNSRLVIFMDDSSFQWFEESLDERSLFEITRLWRRIWSNYRCIGRRSNSRRGAHIVRTFYCLWIKEIQLASTKLLNIWQRNVRDNARPRSLTTLSPWTTFQSLHRLSLSRISQDTAKPESTSTSLDGTSRWLWLWDPVQTWQRKRRRRRTFTYSHQYTFVFT